MNNLIYFLKKEKIEFKTRKDILNEYSEDTSLFKIVPKIVIFPKNKFEISKINKFVYEYGGYNITSRSGGTDMSGGALGESIILSFTKYFNRIISIDKEKKEAVVEPGVFYRDFEKETLKNGLLLPSYPASREICTVGGMVANNSGGEKSLIYGKTENYVLELEVVLSNGEIITVESLLEDKVKEKISTLDRSSLEYQIYKNIYSFVNDQNNQDVIKRNRPKVSKNSAGYYLWNILLEKDHKKYFDLTKVITGSQGTLGVITKIKLSLIKPKKYSKMLLIFLKELKDLSEIRTTVLKYKPESFESYDNHTFKVVLKFMPAFLKQMFKKSKDKNIFTSVKLLFSFRKEAALLLTFGIPKLFLIVEFSEDKEEDLIENVLACENDLNQSFTSIKTNFIKSELESEKYWLMRRESFNLLRQKVHGLQTAPFIDDIIVRGEDLKSFLEKLVPILDKYDLFYTIAGHVGDGNLHIIPLMDFSSKIKKDKNIETIKACSQEVYNLVKKYHGSITAEHNDGLIRTPFLNDMYDQDMLALFKKVKDIFDEKNILNPGKKVPLNKDLTIEIENNFKHLKFKK